MRDLVTRSRVLLAVERYRKGDASLGKAAELAGLSAGEVMTFLEEHGVESRIEKDDYLEGLKHLTKAWQQGGSLASRMYAREVRPHASARQTEAHGPTGRDGTG